MILYLLFNSYLTATIINIPADQPTIQAGINTSVDTDTILVQPGTYFENINYIGKNITVASLFFTTQDTVYISQTIIDGNQNGSVVIFMSYEDTTSLLSGFTIKNGSGYNQNHMGGGIYCDNSSPKLQNLKIIENSTVRGGGIHFSNSSSSINSVIISENNISSFGAGIYCENSNLVMSNIEICFNSSLFTGARGGGIYCCSGSNIEIRNTIINDNILEGTGPRGGGIFCEQANLYIDSVIISGNSAIGTGARGGGLYMNYCFDTEIRNMQISDNEISGTGCQGGGFFCDNSDPYLSNMIILNNTSLGADGGGICLIDSDPIIENTIISGHRSIIGGGIYCDNGSEPIIINTLITDNATTSWYNGGAGICCKNNSTSTLINVTISNNECENNGNGGAIFCERNGFAIVINSILWNNEPQEIEFRNSGYSNGVTICSTDIQGGYSGIIANNNGFINWHNNNFNMDPLFINPLENNYRLQDTSPIIGAGVDEVEIDGVLYIAPEFDIEGNPRPDPVDSVCDMGAYENPLGYPQVGYTNNIIMNKSHLVNYPNPFNPSTTIEFSIPNDSVVEIVVFNTKGQRIKILSQNKYSKGSHSINWNGDDEFGIAVSSGVYYYKLNISGSTEIAKKCLLLK